MSGSKVSKAEAITDRVLAITRIIDAPRELVFETWTNPEHLAHWWGPDGFTITTHEMDVRPGGLWRLTMHGPDGTDYPNESTYIEVVRPERLAYSHRGGREGSQGAQFETTVVFEAMGSKTKIVMQMVFPSVADRDRVIREFGADKGLQQMMGRFDAYMAEMGDGRTSSAADREIVVTRTIEAPREMVFEAWTNPDHVVRWWGPNGFTTTNEQMDVRPGGVWKCVMHGPDGTDYPNRSVYVEVARPERLVYDHGSGIEGEPDMFRAIATFEAVGSGTKVTIRNVFPSAAARDQVAKAYDAVEGGKQTLGRLAEFVKAVANRRDTALRS